MIILTRNRVLISKENVQAIFLKKTQILLNENPVTIVPKHIFRLEQDKILQSEPGSDCSNFFRNSKYDNHICHKDEKPWFIKRNQDSNQNPVPLEIMML